MGFLHLLPALPDAWKEGSVEGLRARGNFLVNLTWRGGKLVQATVVSQSGEPCKVHYNGKTLNFNTQRGKSYTITYTNEKLRVDKKG